MMIGRALRRYGLISLACAIDLGAGARITMRIIALASGLPGSSSAGGSFEVVLFGTLIGLPVALGFFWAVGIGGWEPPGPGC